MKNGDYRHSFPIGKMYKKLIDRWFYDIDDSGNAKLCPNKIFMLIETSLYYCNNPSDPEELCQTDGKVLVENGEIMLIYSMRPDTISLAEE